MEEEKCGKKRRLDQKDKGEEGRKAPCVSKTEAKYKEKEIKLLQDSDSTGMTGLSAERNGLKSLSLSLSL